MHARRGTAELAGLRGEGAAFGGGLDGQAPGILGAVDELRGHDRLPDGLALAVVVAGLRPGDLGPAPGPCHHGAAEVGQLASDLDVRVLPLAEDAEELEDQRVLAGLDGAQHHRGVRLLAGDHLHLLGGLHARDRGQRVVGRPRHGRAAPADLRALAQQAQHGVQELRLIDGLPDVARPCGGLEGADLLVEGRGGGLQRHLDDARPGRGARPQEVDRQALVLGRGAGRGLGQRDHRGRLEGQLLRVAVEGEPAPRGQPAAQHLLEAARRVRRRVHGGHVRSPVQVVRVNGRGRAQPRLVMIGMDCVGG